jgi:hypothetical protein
VIGTIADFSGNFGSGIAFVVFDDGSRVPVESGYGMRVIASCFASLRAAVGKTVEYELDDLGMLLSFSPVEADQ